MTITDDDIPVPPLLIRSPRVSVVEGEVVIDGGATMLVLSPAAALELAHLVISVLEPPPAPD